jgi:hypothetical protein
MGGGVGQPKMCIPPGKILGAQRLKNIPPTTRREKYRSTLCEALSREVKADKNWNNEQKKSKREKN